MEVSDNPRKDGLGLTNRPSTLPHYKPGISYFTPSLKIHKLNKEQLIPGAEPPIRLITALQDGVTKRSDVYLVENILKQLEKDFCADLLTDTTDALKWLEGVNTEFEEYDKSKFKAFTFDFKSLYDSLSPDLVIEALRTAMKECRPDWSQEYTEWLITLVNMDLRSSIGVFDGAWYRQKNGVPTGGSLCVQLANIIVYYVMRKVIYSNESLMKNIASVKRYIDDGAGLSSGDKVTFKDWINTVNSNLHSYGLNIDEHAITDPGSFVPFLDIQFCFSTSGILETDLYIKETDSRAYLNFGSSHPKHTFSGIVYSQCLRLRRITNDNDRLKLRLEELKEAFFNADYPKNMVNNIANKVQSLARSLERKPEIETTNSDPKQVRLVSSFGSDADIVKSVSMFERTLSRTRSFSSEDVYLRNTPTSILSPTVTQTKPDRKIVEYVKKTGPSLRNRLIKTRHLAVGRRFGQTSPCNSKNRKCCEMLMDCHQFSINGQLVNVALGSCASYNIIYLIMCTFPNCKKCYTGRSVRVLRVRMSEHRRAFYQILDGKAVDPENDDFSPGLHLKEHNCNDKGDFNKFFRVCLLEICSPKILAIREHLYIQKYKTLRPNGINTSNPFGIPILN